MSKARSRFAALSVCVFAITEATTVAAQMAQWVAEMQQSRARLLGGG